MRVTSIGKLCTGKTYSQNSSEPSSVFYVCVKAIAADSHCMFGRTIPEDRKHVRRFDLTGAAGAQ